MINIEYARQKYEKELPIRTLCYLINDKQVLLGYKKIGFGKGNIVGIGGKVEAGESIKSAAIREVEEEVFITPENLQLAGVMDFYFPYAEIPMAWNQRVYVYTATAWSGREAESNEIIPHWYAIDQLPFDKMWDDNRYWLEDLLAGEKIWAQFILNLDLKIESWNKQSLTSLNN